MTDEEKAEEKYQEHINKEDCYVSKSEEEIYTDGFFDGLVEVRKENARLSKMLEIVLPKALEYENHIFYEHKRTLEQYRAELEKRVEKSK